MTLGRRIAFAASVSWLSRFIVIGLGLTLIPILFRNMGREELGLWFMLGQSGAFLALMDLGVSPTLTRRIAFAKGRGGGDPSAPMTETIRAEIADLVATGRVIYRFLTAGVFVVAWTSGLFFLAQIELRELDRTTVWVAWTVMCLSHALVVWAAMWSCLLQGTGHVGWDGVIGIGTQVGVLLAQIAAVLLGGGLITLAVIAAVGALATRHLVIAFMRRRQPELFVVRGRWDREAFRSMLSPALKAWATGLGAFLILKTDQYFIAYFEGAGRIPSYHAAYQIVYNLLTLSLASAIASQVFISQLWQAGEFERVRRLVRRNALLGLSVMACGIACLLVVGEELMNLWLGPGQFIGYPILGVFCAMLFLETQHTIVAAASRSTEDEVFVFWALGAGVLNLALTWWLIKPLGLLGVALGTMIAQMLTNNWYAVYRGLWRLEMSKASYFRGVLLPVALTFLAAVALAAVCKHVVGNHAGDAWVVVVGIASTGVVCVGAVWFLVLDASQRHGVLRRLSVSERA
jgi:O-antigen/teichoic acid export membrane protein